ncbi:hypothetical protein VPHK122_0074 [Vibrio phage K122]
MNAARAQHKGSQNEQLSAPLQSGNFNLHPFVAA